jgi:hypothetical protein
MKDFIETAGGDDKFGRRRSDGQRPQGLLTGVGQGLLGAVAVGLLAVGQAEASGGAPEGFVALSDDMGVVSYRVLADGTLELTLADGSSRIVQADAFTITADGAIWVAGDLADALLAGADVVSGAVLAAGAGVIGVLAASGGSSEGEGPGAPAGGGGVFAAVELSDIEKGIGGFVINGVSGGDYSGFSVSSAGDVNGDGFDDLIVGAPYSGPNGLYSGATFVVFGKTDGTKVELSDIENGNGGFVINGVSADDRSGVSVSGAGDVNGDGFDDLIVGAPFDDPNGSNSGASFVVFGKTDGTKVELSDIENGIGGFVINGVSAGDNVGRSVSSAGDVNGDGFDDLIVGVQLDAPNGNRSGASFVVFGKTDGTKVELSDIENGTGGFVINGASAFDASGVSVSSAGDVNGDGFDDLIVGAYRAGPNGESSGASFVVFGKTDGTKVELSDIENGIGGFVINGVSADDRSGVSVSSAGDVNGDGFDDLIVGAYLDDPNGTNSGASFVVFGKTDGTKVELSDIANGIGGFVINGVSERDFSGFSVSSAGDVNGDGFDDLIVGAYLDDPNGTNSGASFVVFGKTDGTKVELSDIENGIGGFVINGVSAFDNAGFSVSAAGDVNGDGFDDLIVGAYSDDPNGSGSGASFVVFGGNFTGAVTQVGTVGDDALTGTSGNDVIFAGTGNDTLTMSEGDDRLSGGAGADLFVLRNVTGTTIVMDFNGNEGDRLDVSDFGFFPAFHVQFQGLISPEGPGGHDTRITLDADTVVILQNIRPDDLVASHVIF